MSLPAILATRSQIFSPIGPIPMDFQRMGDLCRAAHIRYDDVDVVQKDGTTFKHRVWRVVADESQGRDNTTVTQFKKFCMLLDWLEWKHPGAGRNELLETAMVAPPDRGESWQNMNNRLAREGVPKYETLLKKEKKGKAGKAQEAVEVFDE